MHIPNFRSNVRKN